MAEDRETKSKLIEDYALIGDTHSTALICNEASIDWLCLPRHDSPALFTKLLDAENGGHAWVQAERMKATSRRYIPATNILETRLSGPEGELVVTDLMPVHPPPVHSDEGPDGAVQSRILRLITCNKGTANGEAGLHITPDYGRAKVRLEAADDGVMAHVPDLDLRIRASGPLSIEGEIVRLNFALKAGERAFISIGCEGVPEVAAITSLQDADADIEKCKSYWEGWTKQISYEGPYRAEVERGALVMKLLTYSPTGGIVAAATTSLPEAIPGNRNFDYRYSWVRDAGFTITAFCNLGLHREAEEYLRFLRNADGTNGRDLKLLYGIDGEIPPETELENLPGWRGVGPVRIGNAASDQTQFDMFGEFLVALNCYLKAVDYRPNARISNRLPELVTTLADRALSNRDKKDHGIWEFRDRKENFQYAKAMIWVALTHAVRIAENMDGFDPAKIDEWRDAAIKLRAEYEERTWSEKLQSYTQSYESDELDASLLRTVLFEALDARNPRTVSTLRAIEREISAGDLTWRYRMDDGLEGDEGTFTACAFWRVGVMTLAGEDEPAASLFRRLLDRGNDVGLFAEEIDVSSGEHRGNFPQAFTHMAIINQAVRMKPQETKG